MKEVLSNRLYNSERKLAQLPDPLPSLSSTYLPEQRALDATSLDGSKAGVELQNEATLRGVVASLEAELVGGGLGNPSQGPPAT